MAAKKSRTNMKLYMSDFDKLSVDSLQNASENVHLESKQEQEVDVEQKDDASASALSRLETTFARGPLTKDELFACENVLSKSMNSMLFLLPNHHIDPTGLLRGFKFECHAEERATVLPFTKQMFDLVAMYECKVPKLLSELHTTMHPHAMRIFNEQMAYELKLKEYIENFDVFESNPERHVATTTKLKPATFDCIRDEISSTRFTQQVPDKRLWRCTKPMRVGLYHAYVRTHKKDDLEHKMFIVVSGCLKIACEELENIWQDGNAGVCILCVDIAAFECQLRGCYHRSIFLVVRNGYLS